MSDAQRDRRRAADGIAEHLETVERLAAIADRVEQAGRRLVDCLKGGGKVLWMGNGGSAADAQHMATELVGRFMRERRGLPSIALTTDSSALTAIGNDYGYDRIFERQIEALCRPEDLVMALSTSGRSENVLRGVLRAKEIGAFTIGLTGKDGGRLGPAVDLEIRAPSDSTPRIQECHLLVEHLLCEAVDEAFA